MSRYGDLYQFPNNHGLTLLYAWNYSRKSIDRGSPKFVSALPVAIDTALLEKSRFKLLYIPLNTVDVTMGPSGISTGE
jgi:hypothetical protein